MCLVTLPSLPACCTLTLSLFVAVPMIVAVGRDAHTALTDVARPACLAYAGGSFIDGLWLLAHALPVAHAVHGSSALCNRAVPALCPASITLTFSPALVTPAVAGARQVLDYCGAAPLATIRAHPAKVADAKAFHTHAMGEAITVVVAKGGATVFAIPTAIALAFTSELVAYAMVGAIIGARPYFTQGPAPWREASTESIAAHTMISARWLPWARFDCASLS